MFLHIKTIKNIFPPYFSDQLIVGRERNVPKAYIIATSSWGSLRGLESFTQLIYSTKESGFKVTNQVVIIEVIGTLCMLQFNSRKPVNLLLACSFLAHLPKFNPAIPKLQELGEDLQESQRKIVKLRSDQNTSKIIWLYGLRNSFLKCCLMSRS